MEQGEEGIVEEGQEEGEEGEEGGVRIGTLYIPINMNMYTVWRCLYLEARNCVGVMYMYCTLQNTHVHTFTWGILFLLQQ